MIPLVEFPELVQHYAPHFERVFSPEALVQFKRYITGLIVSENKTVDGINRLFVVESRNQSSLNRLLTESPFTIAELNQARLDLLNSLPATRLKPQGVLGVDDTLLTHYGHHFDEITKLYDPKEDRYVWAHNLVTLHYSDDDTDYPVSFQLWKPVDLAKLECGLVAADIQLRECKQTLKTEAPDRWKAYLMGVWRRHSHQPEVAALYDSKLRIAEQLLSHWVEVHPELRTHVPVTFDNWYTQPGFCHYVGNTLGLAYVGSLAEDDKVVLKTGAERLDSFAARLKAEHLQALGDHLPGVFQRLTIRYKGERESYYSYCGTHQIQSFGKVRLVINHRQEDLDDNPVFIIANRLHWQALGITRIRRHRWPVEVYHEEGKAEGLDQYQLRDFKAIERHVALVATVYSLLRAAQHDPVLRQRLQRELKLELEGSTAFWRRATQAHSLWALALFISAGLAQGQPLHQVMTPLLRAVCP
ncbi:MAG: transposase [Chloroflexi bacterium]|nr:transposase [Chloroflexota bacterium]